jgi:hypothetical protein
MSGRDDWAHALRRRGGRSRLFSFPKDLTRLSIAYTPLIARRDPSLDEEGLPANRFDVILRGDGETPFFLD